MSKPTVIVTGASRGMGKAIGQIAAGLGANVTLNARSERDLQKLASEIEAKNGGALIVDGDISDPQVCEHIVEATIDRFDRIDAIVNNAGILGPIAPIAEADPRLWRDNWAVNVLGPVMLARAALPYLRETNGRVINVSSGAAVHPVLGWAAYCASKAALNSFNEQLAAEEERVTAIALRPGVIDTDMQREIREKGVVGMPEQEHSRFVRRYEEGELNPPEKPGRAVAVLALYAPHEWSGRFIKWDSEEVQILVDQHS
jgi:NAD(P)-dependent dehydrogenase (short-subunit alcohol dehydrogenase family)